MALCLPLSKSYKILVLLDRLIWQIHPILAFGESFSRIIIDCVGPQPNTKPDFQYLLTIKCAPTRFPEAIPLRNIKTKTTVKALVILFSFLLVFQGLYNLIKVQTFCQDFFSKSCMNLALNTKSHLLIILKVRVP